MESLFEDARRTADDWWLDLRTANGFLTRWPAGAVAGDLSRAYRAFPLVGIAIGLAGGAILAAATGLGLPALAGGLLAVAAMVAVTGGLHEDGLADLADGLGGATRDDVLRIMRDHAIGSYGVLALVFSVGLRAACLSPFAGWQALGVAVAAAALSRAAVPFVAVILPAARDDGLGHDAGTPEPTVVATGGFLGAAITFGCLGPFAALAAIGAAGLAIAVLAWYVRRRIGGYTGDVLGAAQQLSEIAALAAIAVAP